MSGTEKFIILLISLALVSCAPNGNRVSGYKITIDDSDPLTPVRVLSASNYYWSDSGALCYQYQIGGGYSCYMKAVNETITVEPIYDKDTE